MRSASRARGHPPCRGYVAARCWACAGRTQSSTGERPGVGVRRSRVSLGRAGGTVSEGDPKSKRSRRRVPLAPYAIEALRHTRKVQDAERAEAGTAYQETGYLAVNEIGEPVHPDTYSADLHTSRGPSRTAKDPPARLPPLGDQLAPRRGCAGRRGRGRDGTRPRHHSEHLCACSRLTPSMPWQLSTGCCEACDTCVTRGEQSGPARTSLRL